jgi:ankyrin repeat protein
VLEEVGCESKWRILRSTVRAISLFKTQDVRDCCLETLDDEFSTVPVATALQSKKSNSDFKEAIDSYRRRERFRRALTEGGAEDLEALQREIAADPRRFMSAGTNSRSLVNALIEGQTPLYIAAKNGHREVVHFLLVNGADFQTLSDFDSAQETCLEVAVRWHYIPVIQELMKKSWPSATLKRCERMTDNKEVKKLLKRPKACCF